jgi:hypothetical protein
MRPEILETSVEGSSDALFGITISRIVQFYVRPGAALRPLLKFALVVFSLFASLEEIPISIWRNTNKCLEQDLTRLVSVDRYRILM